MKYSPSYMNYILSLTIAGLANINHHKLLIIIVKFGKYFS
jgi:hypothetical protein